MAGQGRAGQAAAVAEGSAQGARRRMAAAEGVPPGPMSESEIFAQAAKRKQAAIEELTRLRLRIQCVSDAYLCSSLHDRCSQVRRLSVHAGRAPSRPLHERVQNTVAADGARLRGCAERRLLLYRYVRH